MTKAKSSAKAPAKKVKVQHDPTAEIKDTGKREFLGTVAGGFAAVGAACVAAPFIGSLAPSEATKALATVEVDISDVPSGQMKTVLWRGKPVIIWHRNAQQIADAQKDDAVLDPQPDAERVKKPEYLIAMAVCTHLGCVPMQGGNFGGFLCPCHGSQFDSSARVRRGPAATNLEIPPYEFLDDTTIKIG